MKKHVICTGLLALGLTAGVLAQEPKQHSALRPAHRHNWWTLRNAAVTERLSKGDVDLLMIGDSITHSWENAGRAMWNTYYAPRKAVNMGFSGDRTQHVLWRLERYPLDRISPKLAVLMIGTNNSNKRDNTAEEIADGIKAICAKLRKELPEMKILVLAIFPRAPKPCPQREKNAKASKLASEIADGKMIHYLDINQHFLTEDGTLTRAIMPDFLHPNASGYEIWADAMEPKIAELMGETKEE